MASTKDDRILNGKGLAEVWAQTKSMDASILEQAKAYTDQVALEGTVDLSGYATEDWVNNKGYDTVSNVDTKITAAKAYTDEAVDGLTGSLVITLEDETTWTCNYPALLDSIGDCPICVDITGLEANDASTTTFVPASLLEVVNNGGRSASSDFTLKIQKDIYENYGSSAVSSTTRDIVLSFSVGDFSYEVTIDEQKDIPDVSSFAYQSDIPTKVSELDNDVPYLFEAPGGKKWVRSNTISSKTFVRCVYNDGTIWVMGASGSAGSSEGGLYYSTDGKTWVQSNISTWMNCVYGNGTSWVAGYDHGIFYSTDGKTWTLADIYEDEFITEDTDVIYPEIDCVYSDGTSWVASGYDGIFYSTDGKTWWLADSSIFPHAIFNDGTIWVAGVSDGIYSSPDGETWLYVATTIVGATSVYNDGTIWVAGGNGLYYSIDGKTWTQSNMTTGSFSSVYGDGNIWVAGSGYPDDGGLYYSIDGKTWTQSNMTTGSFSSVYGDGCSWVAVSDDNSGLYYSTDGKTWSQSDITTGNFLSVYGDGNIWVADSYYSESIDYIDRKELNEALATASGGATRHVIECGEFGVTMSDDAKAGLEELTAAFIADKVAGCEIYFGENTRYYLAKVTPRVVSDVSYLGLNFASTGSGEERFTMVDMSISWNSDGNLFTGSQHQLLFTGNEAFSHNDQSLDGYDTTIVWWS